LKHADLNTIKIDLELAASDATTYLSFTSALVGDMAGNSVVAVHGDNAKQVGLYARDQTDPTLIGVGLDLTSETLTLSFSETVLAGSLAVQLVTIQNDKCAAGLHAVQLTAGEVQSSNGPTVVLKLFTADLNSIKKVRTLATEAGNTWVSLGPSAIKDAAVDANYIATLVSCDAIVATDYRSDQIAPILTAFKLNMATNKLELEFSETVDLLTFNESEVVLYDGAGSEYRLTSSAESIVSAATNRIIDIVDFDMNHIKLMDSIGKTESESFVYFSDQLVSDMSNNAVLLDFDAGSGLGDNFAATLFTADNVDPTLDEATLDLTKEQLVLSFSEAVRLTDLDLTKMTIHGALGVSLPQVVLSTAMLQASISEDGTEVTVQLSDMDLDALKLSSKVATSKSTTRLSAAMNLIADMQGNGVVEIAAVGNHLVIKDFVEDKKAPTLKQFALNMTAGTITLTFSEAVNANSIAANGIRLQESKRAFVGIDSEAPDYAFQLTEGKVASDDGAVLVVELVDYDLNHIKRLAQVATKLQDTYITIAAGSVKDLNSNTIVPIEDGGAQQASKYAKDQIPPKIEEWRVEMSEYGPPLKLIIRFSETVNVETFDVTDVTIQDAIDQIDADNVIRLTGGDIHAVPME
jgi:hypothetical protein